MAPSEFELRAALHDGEGEGVNAGRVIARARAVRATRRTRLATAAASVVVVGALGTGIGALAHYGGSESAGSASSAGGANAADSAAGAEAGGQAPAAAPQPAAPSAGGGLNQAPAHGPSLVCDSALALSITPPVAGAGNSGPLLPRNTEAVIVCGYRIGTSGGIARHQRQDKLVGPAARELARSLNSASPRPGQTCSAARPTTMLTITVTEPDIAPHQPVIITYDSTCGATATDGTAVRYDWTPPADLAAKLDALTRP